MIWLRAAGPLAVSGTFLVLALSGSLLHLSPALHSALLALFAAALIATLWRAARRLVAPGPPNVDRRIEAASGLRHRPLAALTDRPVTDDSDTLDLWRAHLAREAARSARLRAGGPRPGLPGHDRRALRLGLIVALVAAFVSAGDEAQEHLRRAFLPALAVSSPPPALRLEAWVTPPSYTGAAPTFLSLGGGEVSVPSGSALRVALSGDTGGVPDLLLNDASTPFRVLDGTPAGTAASFGAEAVLASGGRLAIRRDGSELAAWSLVVLADARPSIAFVEPPGAAARGFSTRLAWRAEDDWGVQSARAELRLAARPEAPALGVELPLPGGGTRSVRGIAQPDLSAHPWAGLPVQARLLARDGAGQEGQSEAATLTLPERSFEHPVSRALVALRRALSLDPGGRAPARAGLDRIMAAPEAFGHDTAAFLALRVARNRLSADRRQVTAPDAQRDLEAVQEAQQVLWDVAVALEEGRADRTARALAEAQQALREALADREAGKPEDERRAEIEQRVQELREAIRRHLEAMAERLQRENAEAMPRDPSSRMLDQRRLEQRLERMREAAREGRDEDTERELAEVQEMLRALEEGRTARTQENERRQQGRERGQGQMGAVQDMVRRQSEALDRAHRRGEAEDSEQGRERRSPARPPQRGAPPPEARSAEQRSREEQADARTQRALRRALGELMQQFGDLTGEVPEPLGRADQAMRESAQALSRGEDARRHQERALRELAEGSRQMAQSMQRQFGQGQEGGEPGEGEGTGTADGSGRGGEEGDPEVGQGPGRDPLGRRTQELAGSGEEGGDTRVPEEAEILRTRRLQDELRRRVGERERPAQELDYLDRLLRQF